MDRVQKKRKTKGTIIVEKIRPKPSKIGQTYVSKMVKLIMNVENMQPYMPPSRPSSTKEVVDHRLWKQM